MHYERYFINEELCCSIKETKLKGGRVIAVGTTVLRSLESQALTGVFKPGENETNLFIYPGFEFKVCDGLVTNFHLPESTLFILISAFIGLSEAKKLYQEAISKQYRFFSYGDASLLLKKYAS